MKWTKNVMWLVYPAADTKLRIYLLCLQCKKNNNNRTIWFVCALYFNAFVIYNSCNYTKTEGKLSLRTLVNKIKKSRLIRDTSNIHTYCIFFLFFCIQEFIKIPQTGVTSKLELVSSANMKLELVDRCNLPSSLTRQWGNEDAPNEINHIFRLTDHRLRERGKRPSEVMQPANSRKWFQQTQVGEKAVLLDFETDSHQQIIEEQRKKSRHWNLVSHISVCAGIKKNQWHCCLHAIADCRVQDIGSPTQTHKHAHTLWQLMKCNFQPADALEQNSPYPACQ